MVKRYSSYTTGVGKCYASVISIAHAWVLIHGNIHKFNESANWMFNRQEDEEGFGKMNYDTTGNSK
jgi:hypothetical protein